MFDIENFRTVTADDVRFERQKARLSSQGINTSFIESTVNSALQNLVAGTTSFVIYGDPQSGKTEMMICLTAKLLDEGRQIIVVLLNDNVELLRQNLRRFMDSGIDPVPKNFSEVTDANVEIGTNKWIIFCKKNAKDLRKLNDKLRGQTAITVIDDEADYASPNGKVNKGEITTINRLVGTLLGDDGTYIGVTATPARLDLNNTFDNANEHWVRFPPHDYYTGQDMFFPMNLDGELKYRLTLLSDQGDDPKYLRRALFGYFVNVAFLNIEINERERNYSMLVHTSGKRADHTDDYKLIQKTINVLKNSSSAKFNNYVQELWDMAVDRFGEKYADKIVKYILQTISRCSPVVMNSDADKKNVDYTIATNPTTPFTIAIGGNIISRGVTFHNLLSMFFTRDVKHKIQQDTYIQRARMFGSRNVYLKYFELTIPEHLFLDWHRCFVFHRLAWESVNSGNGVPVWLEDQRIAAVASSSVDKATVTMDSGEMSFGMFDLNDEIETMVNKANAGESDNVAVLKELQAKSGSGCVPDYVIQYVESFSPEGEAAIAIHKSFSIANYKGIDKEQINKEQIWRKRGFIGTKELELDKFPQAMHHFKIFYNAEKKARIFYKYVGNIKFLKNLKGISE